MSAIKNFLLVFDHGKNELIEQINFEEDVERATEAYSEMERKYRDNHRVDIVLVGSDSIETVKVTHSNYFAGTAGALIDAALTSV